MDGMFFDSLNRKGFVNEIATETYGENVRYVNNTTVTFSVIPDDEFGPDYIVSYRVWGSNVHITLATEDKAEAQAAYVALCDETSAKYKAHAAADPLNHMS